jgi:hypothetical protein
MAKHPRTLAARVPSGHEIENLCDARLSPYLDSDPANPPSPMKNDITRGFVISAIYFKELATVLYLCQYYYMNFDNI